jgi:hypothetical protein
MVRFVGFGLMALAVPALWMQIAAPPKARVGDGPGYTADGQLRFPEHYREWVFLTSGVDMSYDPKPGAMSMFDNVFVNPEAYRGFQATGHWPQGTVLVVENRGAETGKSINEAGKTQAREMMGIEAHVLDAAHGASGDKEHPNDGWAFYGFQNKVSAAAIPRTAECYSCHQKHAAVETTFVQFYPTLQEAAEQHGTFSSEYMRTIRVSK